MTRFNPNFAGWIRPTLDAVEVESEETPLCPNCGDYLFSDGPCTECGWSDSKTVEGGDG